MTSKERIVAVWSGKKPDHVPFTTWCFGFKPPVDMTWKKNGSLVKYWYSLRMEHLHKLPIKWELEDDFKRALAWKSAGIDDILDVSVPWSVSPEVKWSDRIISPGANSDYPVMERKYSTPAGSLIHSVKQTGEDTGEGWVIQPDFVPLIEDYNIPRAVKHAVTSPEDIDKIEYLFAAPDEKAVLWFNERMARVAEFSENNGIPVQAWSGFGMDGVIWLTGVEGAIIMASDDPVSFGKLVDTVNRTDYARTELACRNKAVDMIVERGWYSSTDFWSPKLFDDFVLPGIKDLSSLAHSHGKKFGYVMTTGVEILGERLMEAGVDVLYFIDPVQDGISLEKARELFSERMTLVGGANSVSLTAGDKGKIEDEVKRSIDILGPTNRFILHPVDAIFPDTPWENLEFMIETWNKIK
jgi:hypothetical protein